MIRDRARLDRLLATVRGFVREVAIPNEDRVEAEDCVPAEIVAQARQLGFFAMKVPARSTS